MKRTMTEEVTRTYCDVCNKDVTRANSSSFMSKGVEITVCSDSFYYDRYEKTKFIKCEELAKLFMGNPHLFDNLRELRRWNYKEDV